MRGPNDFEALAPGHPELGVRWHRRVAPGLARRPHQVRPRVRVALRRAADAVGVAVVEQERVKDGTYRDSEIWWFHKDSGVRSRVNPSRDSYAYL